MGRSIQSPLIAWLLLVILPIIIASVSAIWVVEWRLTKVVHAGLENDHRLESARIEQALLQYAMDARSISIDALLRQSLGNWVMDEGHPLNESDIRNTLPLQNLAGKIADNAARAGAEVAELKILTRHGNSVGKTQGFSWQPYNPNILDRVEATREVRFGNAFVNSKGDTLLGLVAPVLGETDDLRGFLMLEMHLGPIVDLVLEHEQFGETYESHIAQPNSAGDAEFITLLRFKRDAAFKVVVPKAADKPINWSLESPETQLVYSPDYRQIDSILAIKTIPATGWGLVVKIDESEAFKPVAEIQQLIILGAAVTMLIILAGWFLFIKPLISRLKNAASGAYRVAAGDYDSLLRDSVTDEIGAMSKSIDTLAADLKRDRMLRKSAEKRLLFFASHDDLTGLYNRNYIRTELGTFKNKNMNVNSAVFFLDLDGFKAINDNYGHHIGDELLKEVAKALRKVFPPSAKVVRWGGDEFVAIIPDVSKDQSQRFTQQLNNRFQQPFPTSSGAQRVGCSIGVCITSEEEDLAQCIQSADAMMYAQKQKRKLCESHQSDGSELHRKSA